MTFVAIGALKLMSRFREISGKLEVDSNKKEFKYTKELMCLIK